MRTRRLVLLFLTCFILTHLYHLQHVRRRHVTRLFHYDELEFSTPLPSANSTLGFGGIFAVSQANSRRRSELLWAAELTDIDVMIPRQTIWTDEHLEKFKATSGSIISKGSALAWMGHLNALKWFLSTDLETALILEDDSDWDIRIRTSQVPLLAAALRTILPDTLAFDPPETSNSSSTASEPPQDAQQHQNQPTEQDPDSNPDYWGPIPAWDLLYLGHCDDIISVSSPLAYAYTLYSDPTVPSHQLLHPDTSNFLRALAIPEGHRFVHRSRWPLCTFAYGVNRRSAQLILDSLNKEEEGHGTPAFDVRLLEACRDLGWKCWSVAPELFHHVEGWSEIRDVDGDDVVEVETEIEQNAGIQNPGLGSNGDENEVTPESSSSGSTTPETSKSNPNSNTDPRFLSHYKYHHHPSPHQQSQSESESQARLLSDLPPFPEQGTWNVRCGARHPQLRVPIDNGKPNAAASEKMRTWVQEMVRKGECPIDYSKEERGFAGCEWGECGAES